MGADADWTLQAHLQAGMLDALHVANWQRSDAKKSKYPKLTPRPGVVDDSQTEMKPEPLSIAEIDEFLERAYSSPS